MRFNKSYYNMKPPKNPKLNMMFIGAVVTSIYTYNYYNRR